MSLFTKGKQSQFMPSKKAARNTRAHNPIQFKKECWITSRQGRRILKVFFVVEGVVVCHIWGFITEPSAGGWLPQ